MFIKNYLIRLIAARTLIALDSETFYIETMNDEKITGHGFRITDEAIEKIHWSLSVNGALTIERTI